MHSSVGPREESDILYIEQSKLSARLLETDIALWDVGLGAGTNAFGAMLCAIRAKANGLHVVSFENDLSGMKLALENASVLPHISNFSDAVREVLSKVSTHQVIEVVIQEAPKIRWTVYSGRFENCAENAPTPDIVFFDFYSPKVTPELWSKKIFELVRQRAKEDCVLYTYSASTKVRTALLQAGFFVGSGRATGAKNHTTVAATKKIQLEAPFSSSFLERIRRSHAFTEIEREETLRTLREHPQFQSGFACSKTLP